MKDLLLDVLSNYGLSEIDGPLSNPEILKFFKEIGYDWVNDDSDTAWCSAMLNFFAKRHGLQRSGKLDARSWLKVGEKITKPQLGDVVVLWRGSPTDWRGHVGLYLNEDKDYIWSIGGNVANSIAIAKYPKSRLLGYRRLKRIEFYMLPYKNKTMEFKMKTIYIVLIAAVLLAGTFMLGMIPQKRVIRAQKELISTLQDKLTVADSVVARQQKQLIADSVIITDTKKKNDLLQTRNAAKDKQIINLRYSVAKLSDSITFVLNNIIDCPVCNPDLPSLILPFIFRVEGPEVSVEGYFDEDASLSLKIRTTGPIDTTLVSK